MSVCGFTRVVRAQRISSALYMSMSVSTAMASRMPWLHERRPNMKMRVVLVGSLGAMLMVTGCGPREPSPNTDVQTRIGAVTAARLINRYGPLEAFPPEVLGGERRTLALLFKDLATLRTDAPLFADVDELRWHGPTEAFEAWATKIGDARLLPRANSVQRP